MARLSWPLRCVAAALLHANVCATPATVRVAIPDLAGMLYPQQTQRVESFGSATYASTPFFAAMESDRELLTCGEGDALCLEIVWTSEYDADPFVLTAFESKFQVQSRTFDDVTPTAANVVPVVEGNTNSSTPSPRQTLWRFHSPTVPSIDLLFRLRQQSQRRAVRDQLLLHVTATREDDQSSSATVEAYSIYGNQFAQNTVRRVSKNQIRLDVSIRRNSSRADVVLTDAYPLVSVDMGNTSNHSDVYTWRITDKDCLQCTALLLGCEDADDVNRGGACSFDQSTAALPSCLRASFGLTMGTFKEMLDNNRVVPTSDLLTQCFLDLLVQEREQGIPDMQRQLWNATRALGCLATKQCPFGPLNGVLAESSRETRMIQLGRVSPFVLKLTWDEGEVFTGYFEITFGASLAGGDNAAAAYVMRSDTVNDGSSSSRIGDIIRATLPPFNELDVKVTKSYDDYDWRWSIRVEISNLAFPDLSMRFIITSEDQNVPLYPRFEAGGSTSLQVVELNSSQLSIHTQCDECALELETCRDDDVCRLIVLPCMIRTLEALNTANADVDPMFGTYRISFFQAIESACLGGVPVPSWNPIRRALLCASRHRCAMDDRNTNSSDEWTLVGFTNGTQVIAVPVDYVDGKPVITLSISRSPGSPPVRFATSADKLANFLKLFVMENTADVSVETQPYAADAGMVQLQLLYASTMAATNPVFDGTQGLRVLENVAPRVFFEVGDATTFSLTTLLNVMRTYLNARFDPSKAKYAWELAPECQSCNAELFGCSIEDVQRRACTYDGASSPLGQCIRDAIPRMALTNLLGISMDASYGEESLTVTSGITRCVQTATSLTEDTTQARVSTTAAVSCYVTTKCPFGPLDLVGSDEMVQLITSSYVQTLRLRAKHFRIQLIFSMGKHGIASATIVESDNPADVLRSVLAPLGIRVSEAVLNYELGEYTFTVYYANVVVSDFAVRVGASSVPHPALIEQSVLRPMARLVVMPRIASKVYVPVVGDDDEDPTTSHHTHGHGSNSSSSSGSGSGSGSSYTKPDKPDDWNWHEDTALLPFTRQCELCDSIHLAACQRSKYCRDQLKPYFTWMLNTTANTDVAALLRTCTEGVLFDWWAPIQRWLVCYARNRCPISPPTPGRSGDSYLAFVPATINLTDVWADGSSVPLVVEAPVGSSRHDQDVTATSRYELERHLISMTQGISNLTTGYPWLSPGTIKISYTGPFLGALPSIHYSDGAAVAVSSAAASIYVESTSVDVVSLNALATKLSAAQTTNPAVISCEDCADATLSKCQDLDLLECLHNSLEDASVEFGSSDYNLLEILRVCKADRAASDWLAVYQYFKCMSDNQCPTSENSTSYISFTAGVYHLDVDAGNGVPSGTITLSDGQSYFFKGTQEEIRDEFQRRLGSNASVEMSFRKDPDVFYFEYLFHDSIDEPLWFFTPWARRTYKDPPQVTLYALGNEQRNASMITAAIAKYFVPWNVSTAPCVQHLEDCVRSDSMDSLVCRHRFLPQVYAAITVNDGYLPSVSLSGGEQAIEMGYFLRTRLLSDASKETAAYYLARFFLCLAKTRTSLGRTSLRVPRVRLRLTPGQQRLQVSSLADALRVYSPQGITATNSLIDLTTNPAQDIVRSILGIHDVEIQVTSQENPWGGGGEVTIVYGNYIGWLPTYDSGLVSTTYELLPSLALTSMDWDRKPWTRLIETLGNYSQAGTADVCGTCNVSLSNLTSSLVACVARQLVDLSFGASFSIYGCVNSQPAGTDWLPLAQALQCLVVNGCDIRTSERSSDYNAVFMGSRPGQVPFDLDFYDGIIRPSSTQVVFPRLPGMTDDPQIVYATVDRDDNYTALVETVRATLDTNGQSPTINVTESIANPYGDSLVRVSLTVTVSNYFGFLPTLGGSMATLSSFIFTNVNDVYNELPGQSLSALVKKMVWGTAPPVLKDTCSQYAADLYGCTTDAVTSGACSYNSATSAFGSCLRNQLPQYWYTSSLLPMAMTYVESQLTPCFSSTIDADASSPPASSQDDQWFKVANALAQFEQTRCPFGPLEVALSQLKTIHLVSAPRTLQATVSAASFQAIFRLRVGFRTLESGSFTDNSNNDDLTTLLLTILPASSKPNVVAYSTGSSFVISIQLQYWYLTNSLYTLEVDAGATGLFTASDSGQMTGLVVDDVNTTYLLFGNASSNASSTRVPTPAPTPSNLLPFTKQCQLCDSIHLAACERSTYCRTDAAPTVRTILDTNTGSDLAAEIRAAIGDVFFDRWEPIQRWLVCYARNRCPTSWPINGRTGDSFLQFAPATLNMTNVWEQEANPPQITLQAPMGSSRYGQTVYAASRDEFERLLFAMTQNISNVMRVANPDGSGFDVLALNTYSGPFLGELPVVTATNGMDTNFQRAPASLYVNSTSADNTSMDMLISKLANISSSTAPLSSCSECADLTLPKCQERVNCRGYLLECLLNSMQEYSTVFGNSELDLSAVFDGCRSGLNTSDFLPVYEYFTCLRDHQCSVNDNYPVYLRIQPAEAQLVYDTAYPFETYVTLPGATPTLATEGPEGLRDKLQRAFNSSATVEMVQFSVSTQQKRVAFWYHGLIEEPIEVAPENGNAVTTPVRVALYTSDSGPRSASVLAAAFTRFVTPWSPRTAPCVNHLEDCVRSDSVNSLVCRHFYLPQLDATFTNEVTWLESAYLQDGTAGLEAGPRLRSLIFSDASKQQAALFLSRYLLCLAKSGWPLNRPTSQPPKPFLHFRPGRQRFSQWGNSPFTFLSPQGSESNTRSIYYNNDLGAIIANETLEIPDADVFVTMSPSSSGNPWNLDITYRNYLGWLPTVDYNSVASVGDQFAPSLILTPANTYDKPWTRLIESLREYSRVGVTDVCGNCTAFLDNVNESLAVCTMRDLQNFTGYVGYSIYNCVNLQQAGAATWLPLAQYFQCLVTNGCDVKTGTSTTIAATSSLPIGYSPGQSRLTIDFWGGAVVETYVPVTYPRQPGVTDFPQVVSVPVNRDENYTSLIEAVRASLVTTGQTPVINVTESITTPYGAGGMVRLELNVTVSNFFGFLPSLDSNPVTLSTLLFTNLNSWNLDPPGPSLSSLMKRYVLGTSLPTLKGACASFATSLYDCTQYQVYSGTCTYDAAPSMFMTCLRNRLPSSWYASLLPPMNQQFVKDDLTYCFSNTISFDESMNGTSFADDKWFRTVTYLAVWEQYQCPFGPLSFVYTELHMARLLSTPRTLQATIEATTFQAIFRFRVGFRTIESTQFSETADGPAIESLLSRFFPIKPTVTVAATGSSFMITVELLYWYLDSSLFTLEVDAGTDGLVTATDSGMLTRLHIYDVNTTYLEIHR